MLNPTKYGKKLMQIGLAFVIGATLFSVSTASASDSCDRARYRQLEAQSRWTRDSHIHLDVACPYRYRPISCEFDVKGRDDDKRFNQYFVAINDAAPFEFNHNHGGGYLDGYHGCHFRANNFMVYFPHRATLEWKLRGFAICVPEECVYHDDAYDSYNETMDWYRDKH